MVSHSYYWLCSDLLHFPIGFHCCCVHLPTMTWPAATRKRKPSRAGPRSSCPLRKPPRQQDIGLTCYPMTFSQCANIWASLDKDTLSRWLCDQSMLSCKVSMPCRGKPSQRNSSAERNIVTSRQVYFDAPMIKIIYKAITPQHRSKRKRQCLKTMWLDWYDWMRSQRLDTVVRPPLNQKCY